MGYELIWYGKGAPGPARLLADMHEESLPDSPVCELGRPFMEDFYYTTLASDGAIFGAVLYIDGEAAGFNCSTLDSYGFMRDGARRHPVRLGWTLTRSILQKPARIGIVWRVFRYMMRRGKAAGARPRIAENITKAIRPKFRGTVLDAEKGQTAASVLSDSMYERYKQEGVEEVRMLIKVENERVRRRQDIRGGQLHDVKADTWGLPVVEMRKNVEERMAAARKNQREYAQKLRERATGAQDREFKSSIEE